MYAVDLCFNRALRYNFSEMLTIGLLCNGVVRW